MSEKIRVLRNDCSRLHKLREDVPHVPHVPCFVVEHDWGAVAKAAGVPDGTLAPPMPFAEQAFEFLLHNGQEQLCLIALAWADGNLEGYMKFSDTRWLPLTDKHRDILYWLRAQVSAVLLATESEMADTVNIAAPAKVNAKRTAAGKLPLNDYHRVVVKKSRCGHGGTEPYTGTVRLHFRRGHWRELDGGRVWVKWCLVGNPDLGFIDKEYRV